MPTKREREYYRMGFDDGMDYAQGRGHSRGSEGFRIRVGDTDYSRKPRGPLVGPSSKPKRKLSAWNKYVKANSKKPRFRYRNGKLNLKKMAVAFRKTNKRGGKR